MITDVKPCVTCKWHIERDYAGHLCTRWDTKKMCPVTGEERLQGRRECFHERYSFTASDENNCGQEGKFWESRDASTI